MTTAQPPAPPGPRQTPQARRSAPFPTSPVPRVRGTARAAADAPRRSAAADAPRAPPLRTAASTALLITALRRPTPTDADSRRPTLIGRRASPSSPPRTHPQDRAGRPRTDGTAPSRFRVGSPATRASWGGAGGPGPMEPRPSRLPPVPPRAGSVQRARAAATAAALHAAQATQQPLHAVHPHCGSAPTAAVRPTAAAPPTAAVQAPTTEP